MLEIRENILRVLLVLVAWLAVAPAFAATLPFRFTLDEAATTSAGIFTSDGTLVRTLWRKVDYGLGEQTATWDGLTDEQVPAPAGDYSVRILSHHADYIWQGAIGNTSTAMHGPTVHRGFGPIRDLTITGTNAFYITGYVEGDFDFRHFSTTDPQRVDDRWCWYLNAQNGQVENGSSTIFCPEWVATDTDGSWVYFASQDSTDPVTRTLRAGPGFIVASDVATHRSVSFTKGAPIPNGPVGFLDFANGIKVGTKKGLAGIAVETGGDTLAASNTAEGKIYLLHKRTGARLRTLTVPQPSAMAFAANGDLWVVSGRDIKKITNPATSPVVTTPISQLVQPIDLAVDPTGSQIAVVDAGSSQQIKVFSPAGAPLWTLGQPGGYLVNGPEVTRDKFMFSDKEMLVRGNVTFAPDGSFWVNDPGNRRTLHFAADRSYLEEIMFQNASYSTSVDANNSSRVFCDYQEFAVDYSKPLAQGWKLVKNWGANLPVSFFGFACGLRQVTTLSNGRTYATTTQEGVRGAQLVELTAQGTRLTGIILADSSIQPGKFESLLGSGNVRRGTLVDDANLASRTVFEEKPLTGFDGNNNPQWGAYTTLASAPIGAKDPVTRCCSLGESYAPETSSGILVSFDPTVRPGWHLGGVKKGGNDWLWKASPSVTSNVPLDGLGSFDIGDGVNYAGNSVFASGKSIVFGYHGEFWNQSQACQFMHFYDDGLFVGQFGESGWGHDSFEITVPGRAGNSAFSYLTEASGKLYLWANDESQHGPQRWLLAGDKTIRESSATGTLGQVDPLLIPAAVSRFPVNVQAEAGDGRVSLTWNPVPDATGYDIRLATNRGGIGSLVAGNVVTPGKTLGNLANGQTYYFTVTARGPSGESVESDLASATPVSSTMFVEKAGRYDQAGRIPDSLTIFSQNPALRLPALRKLNPLFGELTLRSVGSAGYRIFNWNATTWADSVNLPFGDTIVAGAGWKRDDWLGYRFQIDGVAGSISGLRVDDAAGQTGTIDVKPHAAGLYYLTVVMPPSFRNDANYKLRLTPRGQTAPGVGYDVAETIGINHIFQFRFRGPVTLSVESIKGTTAVVQAIFLDVAAEIPPTTTGFQLWQRQKFTSADMASPELIEGVADRDQDGQSNLLEYALGTSPTDASSHASLPIVIRSWLGNNYLTMQLTRDRNAREVSLQVGVAGSLTDPEAWSWFDADDATYQISAQLDVPDKGMETIIVRDIMPMGNGPRFMRLSATAQ